MDFIFTFVCALMVSGQFRTGRYRQQVDTKGASRLFFFLNNPLQFCTTFRILDAVPKWNLTCYKLFNNFRYTKIPEAMKITANYYLHVYFWRTARFYFAWRRNPFSLYLRIPFLSVAISDLPF